MDLAQILDKGLDTSANRLAEQYAIVPRDDAPDAVVMQLAGVNEFGRYIDALQYLEGLAMVRQAELVAVQGDTLLLHLYTEGEMSLLLDALALDKKLQTSEQARGVVSLPGYRQGIKGSPENPLKFYFPDSF